MKFATRFVTFALFGKDNKCTATYNMDKDYTTVTVAYKCRRIELWLNGSYAGIVWDGIIHVDELEKIEYKPLKTGLAVVVYGKMIKR